MDQVKIAYRSVGNGPVVILLHGYAGSVLHWDAITENLKENFQVVIPNLTHLYMSKKQLSFSDQVEVFAKFIQAHFPNQKVHLAGASYGGAIVWGVGLRYPELIDKTIFINPMPPAPVSQFSIPILKSIFRLPLNIQSIYMILRTPIGRFFIKRAAEVFRMERADLWDHTDPIHGRRLLFVCHVILNFSNILKNEDWKNWKYRLKGWNHLSMLIFDQQDPLFEPKTYHRFQELIGCTEVREIHLAGHIAINTRADEIAQFITEHLNVKARSTAAGF